MKNFTSRTQKIGELGESIACKYLKKHGFEVLERNYTRKWGEIDIIAQKSNKLYFIEVKSKEIELFDKKGEIDTNILKGSKPEEGMHYFKLMRLRRVVETYLISNRIGSNDWQFDLLVVYLDTKSMVAKVKVIENITL